VEGFESCFEDLEDPRTGNAGPHDLLEMLFIALCTVLSGGQSAVDMAMFAREKETFLREFLKLEHGLPSHDTFSRIFRLLDSEQFRACFQRFMARRPAKGSSRSRARWCDDRSTRPVGNPVASDLPRRYCKQRRLPKAQRPVGATRRFPLLWYSAELVGSLESLQAATMSPRCTAPQLRANLNQKA
jgi:hypothetical protein